MSKIIGNIRETIHTNNSGLINELDNELLLSSKVLSKIPSTVIQNMDSVSLTYTKDFNDTTITTLGYAVGNYIYDTEQDLLYECILTSTIGELLTNITYFTQVTSNNIIFTNSPAHYLNGKDVNGFNIAKDTLNLSLDLSGVVDGIKYIGVEKDINTVVAYDLVTFDLVNGTTNAPNPTCFIPYPVQVQGGVVQDILYDLEKIPDNMMSDLAAVGDIETKGKFKGKNIILGLMRFNGATGNSIYDEFESFNIQRDSVGIYQIEWKIPRPSDRYYPNASCQSATFCDVENITVNGFTVKTKSASNIFADRSDIIVTVLGGSNV